MGFSRSAPKSFCELTVRAQRPGIVDFGHDPQSPSPWELGKPKPSETPTGARSLGKNVTENTISARKDELPQKKINFNKTPSKHRFWKRSASTRFALRFWAHARRPSTICARSASNHGSRFPDRRQKSSKMPPTVTGTRASSRFSRDPPSPVPGQSRKKHK